MLPETALARVVEDDQAPIRARVKALEQIVHPSLRMLRRLLVNSPKRKNRVPSKVRAIAALKYAREVGLRKIKAAKKAPVVSDNPLGI